MYHISDQQIEYILNDIRRNGVETEDLQLNLLDHICCIIEQNLDDKGDFEGFYQSTVRQFYQHSLGEIEEETTRLLTFKNYYAMKKLMIVSGTFSAAAFVLGSMFKAMHWPGASALIVLAIVTFTFLFMPSLFIIKSKETKSPRMKLILTLGVLTGILYSLAVLFAIQQWPGSRILWFSTVGLSMFGFIPLYFFTGIRNPETKFNTIISTVLFVGATGLLFTMLRVREVAPTGMYTYVASEQLLNSMTGKTQYTNQLAADVNNRCEEIKTAVLLQEIGMNKIPDDFEERKIMLQGKNLHGTFGMDKVIGMLDGLRFAVNNYNATIIDERYKIPTTHTMLFTPRDKVDYTDLGLLNTIVQVQLFLANTERQRLVAAG